MHRMPYQPITDCPAAAGTRFSFETDRQVSDSLRVSPCIGHREAALWQSLAGLVLLSGNTIPGACLMGIVCAILDCTVSDHQDMK